jgi:hypothetical protein
MASKTRHDSVQGLALRFVAPVFLFWLVFCLSAALPVLAQGTTPLQGFIQTYAPESKPLDPLLWPGNKFDKQVARSLLHDPNGEASMWRRIPEWQAGRWEGTQAVNTRAFKYVNGVPVDCQPIGVHEAFDRFIKGVLKDSEGQIWHWYKSDYWSETDHGDELTESYVLYSSMGGGEYPDFYAESVDFNIVKATSEIISLRRAKAWTRYIKLGPGLIKEETLRTNFDLQGHPDSTTFNTAVERRTQPFSAYEATFTARKSVVEDFHKYLRQHGLECLIPAVKTPAAKTPAAKTPAAKRSAVKSPLTKPDTSKH